MPTLEWIGKSAVVAHHNEVPFHLLRCEDALSAGDPGSGNLLIQADNLLALKALLPYYAGQVKCIYIDPPYNTGNESWVYNDNVNSPEVRAWLGQVVGREAEDLSRHDKWLCMMYPRLALLRELLAEDGVILVSIDDFEAARLKCLMDEVFGEQNFIAQLVWEKGRKNDAKLFSVGHEYMIVYANSLDTLRRQRTVWREPKPGAKEIWEEYTRLRKEYGQDDEAIERALQEWYRQLPRNHPSKALSRYKHIDANGPWRDRDISWPGGGGPRYDVLHPVTNQPCKVPERGWGFASAEVMQKQVALGLVVFRADHTQPPFRKAHLRPVVEELDDAETDMGEDDDIQVGLQVMPSVMYKQSQVAVRYLRRLMGAKVFDNPKDHEVIARLLRYVTAPGDLVLDSFAGSGTTGHAVLQLNQEDGGDRRFILVEMEAAIAQDITAERLKRAIHGYEWTGQGGKVNQVAGLGGGFRFCRLGPTLFDAAGHIRPQVAFADLARHVYFTETGEPQPETGGRGPLLGVHRGAAIYLLYDGVMAGDQAPAGNLLSAATLANLPAHDGPKTVYAEGCLLSPAALQAQGVTFRHIPYEIKVR